VRCAVLALGSYENRVYQVGVEDDQPVVVKFYRPGRGRRGISRNTRLRWELAAAEIPSSLRWFRRYKVQTCPRPEQFCTWYVFAPPRGVLLPVYPRRGGSAGTGTKDEREWMGRYPRSYPHGRGRRRFEHRRRCLQR